MMLTPWGPRAVPTGGAGVAWPAGIWSLTTARIFFFLRDSGAAIVVTSFLLLLELVLLELVLLELGDLLEREFDGCLPAKDVDEDLQLGLIHIDVRDRAGEVGERARDHPDTLAHLELEAGLQPLDGLDLQDLLDLSGGQRHRLCARPDEARHAWRAAHDVPGVVVDVHADHQVPGEDPLLDNLLLAALELDHVLDWDDDLAD